MGAIALNTWLAVLGESFFPPWSRVIVNALKGFVKGCVSFVVLLVISLTVRGGAKTPKPKTLAVALQG